MSDLVLEENYPYNLEVILSESSIDYPPNLKRLLNIKEESVNDEITVEERIRRIFPEARKAIAFYRAYPDIFIDDIKGPDCNFEFFNYQRIFLRAAMRHRNVFATFPRGFSKSFLTMMSLMIKAILYPGSELFVTAGGKNQASSITISKIEEICKLIPALSKEIIWDKGVTKHSKDNVKYVFKNGSYIDILPILESSRGQRRTGGVMEECASVEGQGLNEIIIPTTVINRRLADGTRHPEELVNQSQVFITTAGYTDSFAYQRLIELLAESVIDPRESIVLGGTWHIPVIEGLQPKNFIQNLKMQNSFEESSFDREYNSIWTGDTESAYYSSIEFDKCRKLLQPEYEYSGKSSANAYYVIAADIARTIKGNCTTEVAVIKCTPQAQGQDIKSIVNFYSMTAEHFGKQSIFLKQLFMKYKARALVVDANGLGVGLVDFLVEGQDDPDTGEYYPPFGVMGGNLPDMEQLYKKFITPETVRDAVYLMKAGAPTNTEAHAYLQSQLGSSRLRFLISEKEARLKLMETKVGQNMTPEERAEKLIPFQLTDNLKDQMLNLVKENEGVNIILRQGNKKIPKDRFSALEYGLYYIKQEEERKRKKKTTSFSKMMFFS